MRFIVSLGLVILLSSCATTTNNYYTKTVASWRGGSANMLVKSWGMPDSKIINPNGGSVYLYKTETYGSYGAPASPSVGVNFTPKGEPVVISQPNINNAGNRGMTLSCITTFMVNKKGTITDTKTQGSGCYGSDNFANKMANPAQKPSV